MTDQHSPRKDKTPKIHALCYSIPEFPNDVVGIAVDEDGVVIASHISSNQDWSRQDMVGSGWKDEVYNERYPQGWEAVWLGRFKESDWTEALLEAIADKAETI